MKITNLNDIQKLFLNNDKKIYGIWITAFTRILPAIFLWEKFEIICYKNSLDNDIFQKITKIHFLQREWEEIEKLDTYNILSSKYVNDLFSLQKNVNILVYKNNFEIEKFAKENNYNIIWNTSNIRDKYENKKVFREILNEIWIETIFWENIKYEDFMIKNHNFFAKKYSNNIVIQLPDILVWWWIGTIFINSEEEFLNFQNKIKKQIYKDVKIYTLNVTKFITWISSSITWCATKFWTLTSNVQTQLVDIHEVINLNKWSGIFCGHDWSFKHFSENINKKAQKITEKLGNYMYKNWYKWIFGLDLIVDEKTENVYVVECNSRYTWAFPMTSLIDLKNWVIPMDAFHLLEFLNIDYEIDFIKINSNYKYNKIWSHIIISNKNDNEITIKKDITPWVYFFDWSNINYLREWFTYNDIQNDNEFIIIDWNPKVWEKIRWFWESSKFCHLFFQTAIMKNEKELNNRTKQIIENIYNIYT